MKRPENGQQSQRRRRRPAAEGSASRATDRFFPAQVRGLAGSQGSPKTDRSPSRVTPNGNHHHGTNRNNGKPSSRTSRREKREVCRSGWDLPQLIRSLPIRRRRCRRKPRMLPHYGEVVQFVFENRYVTTAHVQTRFSEQLGSVRTAQYQLANLCQLGLLAQAPVRSTSPNFPFVYYVGRKGLQYIKDNGNGIDDLSTVPTEAPKAGGIGITSLLHELLITQFDEDVCRTIEQRDDLERLFVERRYFRQEKQLRLERHGRIQRVIPDSGFMLKMKNGQGESRGYHRSLLMLTELDNGSTPMGRLRQKLNRYDRWASSAEAANYLQHVYAANGEPASRPNFRLLIIAHGNGTPAADRRRLLDFFTLAVDLSRAMRERTWLTTVADLRRQQEQPAPLAAAVWYRARDARPWLEEYRRFVKDLPSGRGHKRHYRKREFIARKLTAMRRHSLFPQPEGTPALPD